MRKGILVRGLRGRPWHEAAAAYPVIPVFTRGGSHATLTVDLASAPATDTTRSRRQGAGTLPALHHTSTCKHSTAQRGAGAGSTYDSVKHPAPPTPQPCPIGMSCEGRPWAEVRSPLARVPKCTQKHVPLPTPARDTQGTSHPQAPRGTGKGGMCVCLGGGGGARTSGHHLHRAAGDAPARQAVCPHRDHVASPGLQALDHTRGASQAQDLGSSTGPGHASLARAAAAAGTTAGTSVHAIHPRSPGNC